MTDAQRDIGCAPQRLARVLQLASAASPVGSYAYSDGLEFAVHAGDVHDETSAVDWIGGLLEHSVCAMDVPLISTMYHAWRQRRPDDALATSAWLLACRESSELRFADRQQGQAMLRVLEELGIEEAALHRDDPRISYAASFALACEQLSIPNAHAGVAYAYAWLENTVLSAIKLVPLGQRVGQRAIFKLADRLWPLCERAMHIDRAQIAAGAPGQAIASARHETQATRLFRS